jgi:NAD(P)-dependent dehydrogenase (short-subunit alcohol dehydrogenase family)
MNVLGPSSIRQAVIAQASASPSVASVASVASDSGKRRVLITGGNTGIGFETAKALAHSHKIIVGARNEAKGKAAVAKLKDAVPGASCELAVFDLADLDSVSDFSKAMLDAGTPLDVLINNAGVMACPLSRTKQGFETQIGVNHLGHFLLTEELLPLIQAAGSNHGDARIVNLASSANYGGTINFDDLNWTKRQYSKWPAYCQSKLANVVRPKPVTTRPDSPRLAPTRPDSPLTPRPRSPARCTRTSWTGGLQTLG